MLEILYWAFCPAIVGILYPVKSAALKRLQWTAATLLCLSGWALVIGIAAAIWHGPWAAILPAFAVAVLLLVVAGGIGRYVEQHHLEEELRR